MATPMVAVPAAEDDAPPPHANSAAMATTAAADPSGEVARVSKDPETMGEFLRRKWFGILLILIGGSLMAAPKTVLSPMPTYKETVVLVDTYIVEPYVTITNLFTPSQLKTQTGTNDSANDDGDDTDGGSASSSSSSGLTPPSNIRGGGGAGMKLRQKQSGPASSSSGTCTNVYFLVVPNVRASSKRNETIRSDRIFPRRVVTYFWVYVFVYF